MTEIVRTKISDDALQIHKFLAQLKNSEIDKMVQLLMCYTGTKSIALGLLMPLKHSSKGGGKHCNLILHGELDCAKIFLLKSQTKVFTETFCNPESSTFSWGGVDTTQNIF